MNIIIYPPPLKMFDSLYFFFKKCTFRPFLGILGPKKCLRNFFHISSKNTVFNASNMILFVIIEKDLSELLFFCSVAVTWKPDLWPWHIVISIFRYLNILTSHFTISQFWDSKILVLISYLNLNTLRSWGIKISISYYRRQMAKVVIVVGTSNRSANRETVVKPILSFYRQSRNRIRQQIGKQS